MVQSSLLVFTGRYFHLFRQMVPNTGENAYGREWRNLLCHLEQQVADKSWLARPGEVLLGSPINLVISTSTKFCFQFISTVFHTFDAIEIIAFFRAQFPSACISSPMGFGISHVAFKEPSFWQRGPGVSVQNMQCYACWKGRWWRLGNVHLVGQPGAWALEKSLTRPSFFLYFQEIKKKRSYWPGGQSAPTIAVISAHVPGQRMWASAGQRPSSSSPKQGVKIYNSVSARSPLTKSKKKKI